MKNFILRSNDGAEFDLFNYQGKALLIIVFFRGAWCGHCKKHLAELNTRLDEFNKLNAKLVAISSDTAFKSSLLKTFLRLNFPIISDSKFELIDYFNLRTTFKNEPVSKPAIFVINASHEPIITHISDNYDERPKTVDLITEIKRLTD